MDNEGIKKLLAEGPISINIGIYEFAESLQEQGVRTLHVNWTPPAGGDQDLIDLLDQLL
jgi:hypothetical protein